MTKRQSRWTHVADVESESEPGKTHEVKRHVTTGRLGCSCHAYRFAPASDKICKHIKAIADFRPLAQAAAVLSLPSGTRRLSRTIERITVAGETFAVRRAISFENLTV